MSVRIILGAVLALVLSQSLSAAVVNWTGGGGNSDWQNAANWNPNVIPGSADAVVFNLSAGAAATPVINAPSLVGKISVVGSAVVYLRANTSALTLSSATGIEVNTAGALHIMDGNIITITSNLEINTGTLLVHPGGLLTITGTTLVQGASAVVGAFEDGTVAATAGMAATINYSGDVRVDCPGGLKLGEGIHNFGSNIDLGFTAAIGGVVTSPQLTTNDVAPAVNLINNNSSQQVKFDITGSAFLVSSVTPGTRVTQSGKMILVGNFDVSGATSGSAFVAWAGTDPVEVGDGMKVLTADILTGNGEVQWGDTLVADVQGGAPATSTTRSLISVRGGVSGRFVLDSMIIQGDTTNQFPNADENNSPQVTVQGCTLEITNDLIVSDGSENGDASGTGGGGSLIVRGATLECFIVQVGNNVATGANGADEGAQFTADSASVFDFLPNGILDVRPYTTSSCNGVTFTGSGAVTISVITSATRFELLHSTVTASSANNLTVLMGSQDLRLLDNTFSNYTVLGVQFAMNTMLTKLEQNRFKQGVSGGTHITFNGLANSVKVNCDGNLFDASTQPYTTGDHIVTQNFTPNLVNFRLPGNDFGEGAFVLTRATCESQDDDNGISDPTQVAWQENANSVSVLAVTSPNQVVGAITDGFGNQPAMLFTIQAIGGVTVIDSLRFRFDALSGDVTAADVGYVTLFDDANSNGAYDAGEEFVGSGAQNTADEPLGAGGDILFDLAAINVPAADRTIATSAIVRWGVAITFLGSAGGHGGQLRVRIEIGEIDDGNDNVLMGLPIQNILDVTGPVNSIAIIQEPTVTPQDTVIAPAPVVELRDAANRVVRARSYNVTASIFQGTAGAVLSGTPAVSSSLQNGRATFSNLLINLAGANYILRFTSQAKTGDSAVFTITGVNPPPPGPLGPGGGGGGCSAGPGTLSLLALAVLLSALALPRAILRRSRR
ncbi:MAG: hypothetical protein IT462_10860 [Planctomycetes bacterium]|nr:hypothetical protein [Planctomycetota bacterium]